MDKHEHILNFIYTLRTYSPVRFQCGAFHCILKSAFPQLDWNYNSEHCISEFDGKHYDIDGLVDDPKNYLHQSKMKNRKMTKLLEGVWGYNEDQVKRAYENNIHSYGRQAPFNGTAQLPY